MNHLKDKTSFIGLAPSLNGSSPIVWKNWKRRAEAAKGKSPDFKFTKHTEKKIYLLFINIQTNATSK